MVMFGVASEYMDAPEESKEFMETPKGLVAQMGGSEREIWRMRRSLYGRHTADASWRDCKAPDVRRASQRCLCDHRA